MDMTPELLSPAGNWDCARAAVGCGADAIYFGLGSFNARLRADNFTDEDLPELMEYLHRYGVRGFVTMNTLIFSGELDAAEAQLRRLAAARVDAIIVQDLGLAALAHAVVPELELHASTQMTITSPEGLAFVEGLFPLERAVLARELSIREIGKFRGGGGAMSPSTPIEVFVHGALCVAYSGQCLTSESLGQRSANRGECAQACRMPYELVVDGKVLDLGERRYLLSPQDLAAVDLIPELVAAGVKSFKIEGRLKSPEYVAAVTGVYRKALDAAIAGAETSPVDAQDRYELEMTFSRGLTSGWLAGTDHPYLTHGKFGKKRGPWIGDVAASGPGWVELEGTPEEMPLRAGDGVVFDAGEDRDFEQGGRIWKLEQRRLWFHSALGEIDFSRVLPGMGVFKTSDPQLDSGIRKRWRSAKPEVVSEAIVITVEGAPGARMVLVAGGETVVSRTNIEAATGPGLDGPRLTAQLSKLTDTGYHLTRVENCLNGACHLAVSEINRMRRELVDALNRRKAERWTEPKVFARPAGMLPEISASPERAPEASLSVLCRDDAHLAAAIAGEIKMLYLDFEDPRRYRGAVERLRAEAPGARVFLASPRIIKPGETGYLRLIDRAGADGILARNLAVLHANVQGGGLPMIGDFSLNVANPITARLLMEAANLECLTVSYDLNAGQVLELLAAAPPEWFELTLHQHMPMFHMEHCVFCTFLSKGTTYKDCGRPCETHSVKLRDRVGQLHPLHADVGCRNTLFNGRAQTGARFFGAMQSAGLRKVRIELLGGDEAAALRTIASYRGLLAGQISADELVRGVAAIEKLGVTEGTLAG